MHVGVGVRGQLEEQAEAETQSRGLYLSIKIKIIFQKLYTCVWGQRDGSVLSSLRTWVHPGTHRGKEKWLSQVALWPPNECHGMCFPPPAKRSKTWKTNWNYSTVCGSNPNKPFLQACELDLWEHSQPYFHRCCGDFWAVSAVGELQHSWMTFQSRLFTTWPL